MKVIYDLSSVMFSFKFITLILIWIQGIRFAKSGDLCTVPNVQNGAVYDGRWNTDYKIPAWTTVDGSKPLYLRCVVSFEPCGKPLEVYALYCVNGKWSQEPKCIEASCRSRAPVVQFATLRTQEIAHGTLLTYFCNHGYHKAKFGHIECKFGTWIGKLPICKNNDCNELPPLLKNGLAKYYTKEHGTYVIYGCNENFTLEHSSNPVKCNLGKWEGDLPVCKNSQCYIDTLLIKDGIDFSNPQPVSSGEYAELHCLEGYTLKGPTPLCDEGIWMSTEPLLPYCYPSDCHEAPPVLKNGSTKYYTREHGTDVVYVCYKHFIMENSSNPVKCNRGKWEGDVPVCKDSRCYMETLAIENGIDSSDFEPTFSGEYAELHCLEGYTLKGPKLLCDDGTLTYTGPVPPYCYPNDCNELPPLLTNGLAKYYTKEHGGYVTYVCNENFILEFSFNPVKCNLGKWEGNVPVCKKAPCAVRDVRNGTLYTGRGHSSFKVPVQFKYPSGSILYISCTKPYIFHGKDNSERVLVTCENGKWNPAPICLKPGDFFDEESIVFDREPNSTTIPPVTKQILKKPDEDTYSTSINTSVLEVTPTPSMSPADAQLTTGIDSFQNCPCTYDIQDDTLLAYSENKLLNLGDEVKNGNVVRFVCSIIGYYQLKGMSELQCVDCSWQSEFPVCELPRAGDPILNVTANDSKFIRYTPSGAISVIAGVDIQITCHLQNLFAKPSLRGPSFGLKVERMTIWNENIGSYVHTASINIKNINQCSNGRYVCSRMDGRNPFSILIEVADPCAIPNVRNGALYAGRKRSSLKVPLHFKYTTGSILYVSCTKPYIFHGKDNSGRVLVTCENGKWNPAPICREPGDFLDEESMFADQIPNSATISPVTKQVLENPDENMYLTSINASVLEVTTSSSMSLTDAPITTGIHSLQNCSCTYDMQNDRVLAYSENKLLNLGDEVKNGRVVHFVCSTIGYYRLKGMSELQCVNCSWQSEGTVCELPRTGDPILNVFTDDSKFVTHTPSGALNIVAGVDIQITCHLYNLSASPSLRGPSFGLQVEDTTSWNQESKNFIFTTSMSIKNIDHRFAGQYVCSSLNGRNSFSIQIEVTDGDNFGEESTISSQKPSPTTIPPVTKQILENTDDDKYSASINVSVQEVTPTFSTSPAATQITTDIDNLQNCSCTYDIQDDTLLAYSGNKLLYFGDEVRNGYTVNLSCSIIGYYRFKGLSELQCLNCSWQSEFPVCEVPRTGDPVFSVFADEPKFITNLPSGSLNVVAGVDIQIICHLYNLSEWPFLRGPNFKLKGRYKFVWNEEQKYEYQIAYITIKNITQSFDGHYICEGIDRIPFSVQIEVEELHCPLLEEENGLLIMYDGSPNLHSTASFFCDDKNKRLYGAEKIICLENGKWSADVPNCEFFIECPELQGTEGLIISYTNGIKLNSTASFHCSLPYRRMGVPYITCLENGEWSYVPPTCYKLQCPRFEREDGLSITYVGGQNLNSTASFSCDDKNKRLYGAEKITCLENGKWSADVPKCEFFVECPELQETEGLIISYTNERKLNSTARFRCSLPYRRIGVRYITCLEDGEWSYFPPTCFKLQCPLLEAEDDILITYESDANLRSTASFSCYDENKRLYGAEKITCLESGKWSADVPKCEFFIECPELQPTEGLSISYTNRRKLNSLASFNCSFSYQRIGVPYVTCLESGEWSHIPATCRKVQCPILQAAGGISITYEGKRNMHSTASFFCRYRNYKLYGPEKITCLESGKWSDDIPKCEIFVECPELQQTEGLTIFYTNGRNYNSSASFNCSFSYQRIGVPYVTCLVNGEWSHLPPTCHKVQCPVLKAGGGISITYEGKRNVHSTASFVCHDKNYKLYGAEIIACLESGKWSADVPKCEKVQCPLLKAEGGLSVTYKGKRNVHSTASFFCREKGYKLYGAAKITCLENGKWSDDVPKCEFFVECPELQETEGLTISYTNGRNFNSSASFNCSFSYRRIGVSYINCLENGEWSHFPATCHKVQCPILKAGGGISIMYEGKRNVHSTASFFCHDKNYKLYGAENITCLENGKWSDKAPICKIFVECPELQQTEGLIIAYTDERNYNSSANFNCSFSYRRVGVPYVTCLVNGEWSHHPPTCHKVQCPVLKADGGISIMYEGKRNVHSTASFSCHDENYKLYGAEEITCLESGKWSDNVPKCKFFVECPELQQTEGLTISYTNGRNFNSTASFSCNFPYQQIGVPNVTCLVTGKWSHSPATCRKVQCPVLKADGDISIMYEGKRNVHSTASFFCRNENYKLYGAEEITCLESGKWSDDVPKCEFFVECPKLQQTEGLTISYTNGRNFNSSASFSCGFSYQRIGVANVTCLITGKWSHPPVTCRKVQCPVLKADGDISITYEGKRNVRSTASFFCRNENYKLYGAEEITCLESGKWSDNVPKCKFFVECTELQQTEGLTISYTNGRNFNSSASFKCSFSYRRIGVPYVTCLKNGEWSHPPATCRKVQCPVLKADGGVLIVYEGRRNVHSTASFFCHNENYKLYGAEKITCLESGEWSADVPKCGFFVECPELQETEGLTISYTNGRKLNSVANFDCSFSYQLIGLPYITCLENGEWSHPPSTCHMQTCSVDSAYGILPVTMIPNLENVIGDHVPYGTALNILCIDDTHSAIGNDVIKCGENGKWTVGSVSCVFGCGPIKKSKGSSLIVQPEKKLYEFGETIVFSCPPGQELTLPVERVLCFGNKWSEDIFPDCVDYDS